MEVQKDTEPVAIPLQNAHAAPLEQLPDGTKPIPLGSGVITSLISKGGTALVYEIWNNQLEVTRAVKLLNPDYDESSRERFETEIKITAKLHHPNIVEIYNVGNWKGLPYIEMERIEGATLEGMLEKRGALPVEVCTAIGIMVSRALYHAHNHKYMIYGKEYHGIIHRDLKPANIMVSSNGTAKLMDFGIAKPVAASRRTMEGMVVGTMQYLAPEQLQGFAVDIRADIYSFGAVLYELLTGCKTFPEENLAKLVTQKLANEFRPIEDFRLKAPLKLKALVSKCLLFQKKDRIQSTLVLVKNLEVIHESLTKLSPEESIRHYFSGAPVKKNVIGMRNKFSALIVTAAVVILCAGGGASLFYFLESNQQVKSLLMAGNAPAAVTTEPPAAPVDTDPVPPEADQTDTSPAETVPEAEPSLPVFREDTEATVKTVSREPARPVPEAAVRRSAPRSSADALADQVAQTFATADMLSALDNEMRGGRHRSALEIIDKLPPDASSGKKVQILKMRALQGVDDRRSLAAFLTSQNIDDGEFYVNKAIHFCRMRDFAQAGDFLNRSMSAQGEYVGLTALNQSRAYARALIAAGAFDAGQTPANRASALEAWNDVKQQAGGPDGRFAREADEQIGRLGKE